MTNHEKIWRPIVRHRSVLLGTILIGIIWAVLFLFLTNERESAERAAVQNATNLAGAFEDHLSHSLSEIDRSLAVIGTLYAQGFEKFDLADSLKSNRFLYDGISRVWIIGSNGRVKASNGDAPRGDDLSDRDYFQNQRDAHIEEVYIGKPILSQATGKWSIPLSRRILGREGSFGGVVVAFLDPSYLTLLYNSVNIGQEGYIRIIGLDGVVRATSGQTLSTLGKDFSEADLFRKFSAAPTGWFYTRSNLSDNVERLVAYRIIYDYPLIITVSLASNEIFSRLDIQKKLGYLVAALLTLIIAFATGLSIKGQLLREGVKKHLEHANMLLNATLANMPHGICMFGADKKLVLANDLYSTMYGLNPADIKRGATELRYGIPQPAYDM